MSIYPIAYMVEKIIFHHPINHIYHHHHHFSLLTLCGKRVKQSQTVRSGRFESNLLTWPGRPNTHVWEPSHPHDFSPFLSGLWIRVTVLDYRVRRLCTRMCAHEKRRSKKVKVKSTCRSNQVLKLTDYHILGMCLVRSNA